MNDSATTSPADLVPAQDPDRTERAMPRWALRNLLDDSMDGDPLAQFTGIAYALGVYALAGFTGYAVAPAWIGGPPRAMAQADVRFFDAATPQDMAGAYARACLWALRQTVEDLHLETVSYVNSVQAEAEAQWADVEAGAQFDRDNPPNE